MTDPLILDTYTDSVGTPRSSPEWAVERVRDLLADSGRGSGYIDVIRTRAGQSAGRLDQRVIQLETGEDLLLANTVPPDLPFGYHRLDGDHGPILVLHAPPRVPSAPSGWVLAAQLYSARSATSWGHGDLADARRLAEWIDEHGPGGYLMVNPLHAPLPGPDPQPSPYFASSRIFRNPMYLSVENLAGVGQAQTDRLRDQAHALNRNRLIDRHQAWPIKREALAAIWASERAVPETAARVERWLADPVNRSYAAFCVSAEDPRSARPTRGSLEPRQLSASTDAERFQAWLQLMVAEQLDAVGPNVIHDVAVGTDRAGADPWLWPDCFVLDGTRIGCPPDQFNTQGQDWGLPPLHPLGLRAAGYEPFVRAIRSAATGAAGIRIDHVMGLERLFWIPEEGQPADGVYVQYPLDELLDVVAIETHRAGAFVVGEDLGTVPPSIPAALAERGMLSYRVMSLDDNHPSTYPVQTMASVTTHDLATTAGFLTGSDLQDQQHLGLAPNVADTLTSLERLRHWIGATGEVSLETELLAIHQLLSSSPALLAAVTLEDLAVLRRRPNMPGTIDAWPNWSIGLPNPLEAVLSSDLAQAIGQALARRVDR